MAETKGVHMLIGEKIFLTPLDIANAETARTWINDPAVNEWLLSGQIPVSREGETAFYAADEADRRAGTAQRFEIHVAEDGRYIGNCGLEDIDRIHRHAEIGICIGSLPDQNNGYGRDTIVTLLRFAFDTLGLHRVEILANAENERAVHLYRSIGFTEVGRQRETVYMRGKFRDHLCLDMLDREFRERYGKQE
ncbi:MAG: GNAT family protein [Actinomycetota bacterium]|nr:MAG: GCN5-like [Actinomycetota bacterium]MDO8950089.1 GNAT family protein [Actinomycetota bacterium]MDP3629629.1 GNAT family protein [Actinomycetota bacterium]